MAIFYIYTKFEMWDLPSAKIKMDAIINENTSWYMYHICMFTAERKLEQWRHSFDKVGAVHSPSARSAIIDIFITIIIIIINIIFLFFYF